MVIDEEYMKWAPDKDLLWAINFRYGLLAYYMEHDVDGVYDGVKCMASLAQELLARHPTLSVDEILTWIRLQSGEDS